MVMPTNLSLCPEFEKAKADLQTLREKYAALLEEYAHLTGTVAKNLETEYMMKIGQKEYQLFVCKVEIQRIKREISLFQAARNRGETISQESVRKIISEEFSEYRKQQQIRLEKLEKAEQYFAAPKYSAEETDELKKLYRTIVRKLHPDLNPDLSPAANALWLKVQNARQCGNWAELHLLADMVNEMLSGKTDYVESINSLQLLHEELAKTAARTDALEKQITMTRQKIPFIYEQLLSNPAEVIRKRNSLDEQIRLCREQTAELKKIREEF